MLKFIRTAGVLGIALATSACVGSNPNVQADLDAQPGYAEDVAATTIAPTEISAAEFTAAGSSPYTITEISVIVPDYLVVSEADVYVPKADIVWREDPLGDRKLQVKSIMQDALQKGTSGMNGRPVIMAVQLKTFHALTEKARETTGGKHNIEFDYVLLDAETRTPIIEAKRIDASLRGYGGRKAYKAMRAGQTQKVRITDHVAKTIRDELTKG
ncbi:MAG: DUF6778 family protein [Pseudomonadota bacterium]